MSIEVQICNDALNFLGAEPINSLSDNDNLSRTCKNQYPIARDYILRTHLWNFSLRRASITPSGGSLQFGETNQFHIPSDCVRINKVLDDNWNPLRYKTEGRFIYSNAEKINLSYVSNEVLEGNYDPAFMRAVAAQLAGDMCYKVTQSTSLMQGLYNLAENFAKEARSLDSMENTPDDFQFNYFDDARRAGHEIYPKPEFM